MPTAEEGATRHAEGVAGDGERAGGGGGANEGRDKAQNGGDLKRPRTMKTAARTILVGTALCPKVETLQKQARRGF